MKEEDILGATVRHSASGLGIVEKDDQGLFYVNYSHFREFDPNDNGHSSHSPFTTFSRWVRTEENQSAPLQIVEVLIPTPKAEFKALSLFSEGVTLKFV